ncbi:hypothetical protein GF385_01365 [Candidatus Dependentiae bacterium]|nr:hypothetical protein [Candidatus Dependentiae bacterium]
MTHWGWYWRVKLKHRPKKLCSNFTEIDSFMFFKNGYWRAFSLPKINLTIIPNKDYFFEVFYGKEKKHFYKIPFERQKCNYGGYRYYFHCPLCDKRMRKLYFTNGAFLCRKCLNLGYYSQIKIPSRRYWSMQDKIEKKLEERGGSISEKPKYMKWSKFKKMVSRYYDYKKKSHDAAIKELLEWYP